MTSLKLGLEPVIYEDLSGTASTTSGTPYDALIDASIGDMKETQNIYHNHRMKRLAEQKAKMLSPDFPGVICDPILQKLYGDMSEPDYQDPRHCLVFWARPPNSIRSLIMMIQKKLLAKAPNTWLMPVENLHMTAMEITHSRTAKEISDLVQSHFQALSELADYTFQHRVRLIKPLLSFDAQGLALSFLPTAGEVLPDDRSKEEDVYTYHNLRRDLYTHLERAGIFVDSRYVVPSAHITIARFITSVDFRQVQPNDQLVDVKKVEKWINSIEEINFWLQNDYWPKPGDKHSRSSGEWIVGQDKGLDLRQGTLWYGGGDTVKLGKGF